MPPMLCISINVGIPKRDHYLILLLLCKENYTRARFISVANRLSQSPYSCTSASILSAPSSTQFGGFGLKTKLLRVEENMQTRCYHDRVCPHIQRCLMHVWKGLQSSFGPTESMFYHGPSNHVIQVEAPFYARSLINFFLTWCRLPFLCP